ncbi:DDB1- and CUL4-associated factor 8 isoform X1 [Vigna radiata var. radiata]|uniref:DDB1- and CUL4-associated factor 8 isoform X1 n=1 Tax=Vigna radiata var. radiata TaxID=3916 RepID=A0A1S3V6D1_VIGRR|nr:DDB1- and CUL4-associated factor 8 isoform X1 [Vigna radiata var. radiata]XP_022641513.1 DDB1- and CUL4-associated factor 8 isoform X1 [Vigna radiata var. radiata]
MNKRPITAVYKAIPDLCHRELGHLPPRNFALRLGASEDLVLRLDVLRKLHKHRGCVNTVSFNTDGDILVSGSDDWRVILWDWETGRIKLSFHSGHNNNVFQAKIMPHSEDRSIVTCAADGQVRHAKILENGGVETKFLAKHQGRAHKLAIEPGSPHIFYTCGEDGLVQHFDLRTGVATELFTCQPIQDRWNYMPVIHLNAIAIDPRNPNLFAVAGTDEYTRLYDIRKYKWDGSTDFGQPTDFFCPPHLIGDERVGITGLAFSEQRELLVSYNDEFIYLFTQDMGLGPNPEPGFPKSMNCDAGELGFSHGSVWSQSNMDGDEKITPQVFKGHRNCDTVKGVNFFGPNCEYVVSGSDCGRIFVWKKKSGQLIRVMEADKHVVNCIESHPHTMVLASSGIEHDIKIWTPKALEKATLPKIIEQVHVCDRVHWFSIGGGVFDEDYHIMSDVEFSDGMLESDDDEEDKEEDDDDDDENVNEYDCDYDYEYDYYDDDEEEEEEEESEEGDSDDCDEDDG